MIGTIKKKSDGIWSSRRSLSSSPSPKRKAPKKKTTIIWGSSSLFLVHHRPKEKLLGERLLTFGVQLALVRKILEFGKYL